MEFADLIPIPKLDGVTLSGACYKSPVDGTLCMTGHHLILSSRKQGVEELWVRKSKYLLVLKVPTYKPILIQKIV